MDMENLVEMITKEVMKRIQGLCYEEKRGSKEKVLLLGDFLSSSNIKEALEEKYIVDSYKDGLNIDSYKAVVLPNLCLKGLSNLALGLCNGEYEEVVIKALFKGKKVYILEDGIEYRSYMSSANKNLYKLYIEYERKLTYNGIDILNEANLINVLLCGGNIHKVDTEIVCEEKQTVMELPMKKLIAESDLRKLCIKGIKQINIAKKSILTPLAQDFIRINHLKLNRI